MTARTKPAFDGAHVGSRELWPLIVVVAVWIMAPAVGFCAEASPIVVLVADESPSKLVTEGLVRTRAELEAGGFAVHLKAWNGTSTPTQLFEEATVQEDVTAIIVIAEHDEGLRAKIALRDRLSGMITPSFVDALPNGGAPLTAALAIRTLERVRASLLEIETARRPVPTPLPPPSAPPVERPKPPAVVAPIRPYGVEMGVAALMGFDELGTGFGPELAVTWDLGGGPFLRARIAGPLFGGLGFAQEGDISYHSDVFVGQGGFAVAVVPGRLRANAHGGLGTLHLELNGSPVRPPESRCAHYWAFAASAGAGLDLTLIDALELGLNLDALFSFPRLDADLGTTHAGSLGRPTLMPSLGARFVF